LNITGSKMKTLIAHFALAAMIWLDIAAPASAQSNQKIPELASSSFAWLVIRPEWLDPGNGLRGPIMADPTREHHMNQDGAGQVTKRMGNWRDPVLKPWVAEHMRISNEEVDTGKRGLPFSAQATCHPGGVPGQLLYPAEPFYFIQTPKVVYMIWQRDHMVRRIYMTERHSDVVKPSWFGESIGRYENGELVIDTVGLQTRDKMSYIDNFRTKHTEKLHVVERFKLAPDGKALQVNVGVTDPDAYNEPLNLVLRWRKVNNPLLETVCAENNEDHYNQNLFPIPQASKPDF
jgi:hypothetical protein